MSQTKIEWATHVWNPTTGCSKVSAGCQNCYAERMAKRLAGRCGYPKDDPFRVTLHPDRLDEPLRWRKPRRVFVCSMGDLFHPDVPFEYIDRIFSTMALAWQHTFLILTKRPERMRDYITTTRTTDVVLQHWKPERGERTWPLSNVWLGVTAENQEMADERIPILLQIPAAVRFVSCEPLLSAIDLTKWLGGKNVNDGCRKDFLCSDGYRSIQRISDHNTGHLPSQDMETSPRGIDWCIVGGETGPSARPMHPDWVRSLRNQCVAAGAAFFFKQWGQYCYPEQMPPETYRQVDAAHNLAGNPDYDKPWGVGKKSAGRLLDGQCQTP